MGEGEGKKTERQKEGEVKKNGGKKDERKTETEDVQHDR